jgi:hypothetical protein
MSYETFSPIANGWRLQRGFKWRPEWMVAEDQRELGNVSSTLIAQKPRRTWSLTFATDTRDACEYLQSFFNRLGGPAARFYYQFPEYIPSPDAAPGLTATVSGSQAERSITVRYAWKNASGTTRASATGTLLVPANNLITVALPIYPPSVTQAVIYAAEGSPGNEQEQTTLTGQRSWLQPSSPLLLLTAAAPTANTATEAPLCRLVSSYEPVRGCGTQYSVSLEVEEVYS